MYIHLGTTTKTKIYQKKSSHIYVCINYRYLPSQRHTHTHIHIFVFLLKLLKELFFTFGDRGGNVSPSFHINFSVYIQKFIEIIA